MARDGALATVLLVAGVVLSLASAARQGRKWTYYGDAGPEQWPTLGFPRCSGERQSPINVVTSRVVVTSLPRITFRNFDQVPLTLTLENNYHSATAKMTWEKTPTIEDGDLQGKYEVVNFHFHWGEDDFKGSEHTVDGESYPLEMHIVCMNTRYANISSAVQHQDGLAVLGVMFEAADLDGRALQSLEPALQNITAGGAVSPVERPPRLLQLLPWNTRELYRYRGSLTTPGCYQAVTWTIFTETLRVTHSQLALFRALRGGPAPIGFNYRPPQRRHGRTVLFSTESNQQKERRVLQQLQQQLNQQREQLAAVSSRSGAALVQLSLLLLLPPLQLLLLAVRGTEL